MSWQMNCTSNGQVQSWNWKNLEAAYHRALEVCAGGRLYFVIADNEETGKALLDKGQLRCSEVNFCSYFAVISLTRSFEHLQNNRFLSWPFKCCGGMFSEGGEWPSFPWTRFRTQVFPLSPRLRQVRKTRIYANLVRYWHVNFPENRWFATRMGIGHRSPWIFNQDNSISQQVVRQARQIIPKKAEAHVAMEIIGCEKQASFQLETCS